MENGSTHFNGLLHEQHRNQQAEELTSYSSESVNNGAGPQDGQQEQQEWCPHTYPEKEIKWIEVLR